MPINDWSDDILIAEMADEPTFSEEMGALHKRVERSETVPDVIVDLKEITFLNSSNIAQLMQLRQMLHNRKRRLRVCSVDDQVWSMLLLTGLDKLFEFNDNVATALASLQIESAEPPHS